MSERWVRKRLIGIALVIASLLLLFGANEARIFLSQTYPDVLISLGILVYLVWFGFLGSCLLLIGILLVAPKKMREGFFCSGFGKLLKLNLLLMIKRG